MLAEHNDEKLSSITLNAIGAASKFGDDITCLVMGSKCEGAVKGLTKIKGLKRIVVAEDAALKGLLPGTNEGFEFSISHFSFRILL